jgi:hypothetical protein
MPEVMIKVRLFTWFQDNASAANPDETVRMEKISVLGEVVDIDDDASYQRGQDLDAFFTDEERQQVEDGTYTGPGYQGVYAFLGHNPPESVVEPLEGEGTSGMTTEEMADHIKSNRLTVEETVALAGDDADSINKVLDAENIATDNDPRKGVEAALEAKLAAAQS